MSKNSLYFIAEHSALNISRTPDEGCITLEMMGTSIFVLSRSECADLISFLRATLDKVPNGK